MGTILFILLVGTGIYLLVQESREKRQHKEFHAFGVHREAQLKEESLKNRQEAQRRISQQKRNSK